MDFMIGCLRKRSRPACGICLVIFLLGVTGGCAPSLLKQQQAETHLNMGIAYLESAQYHSAMKELLSAENYTPSNPKIHYYLGISYHGKGLDENAIEEFNSALALKPDYSEASNYLGTIYLTMGLWDKAIESFERALANILYDTPSIALYNMGQAYYKKGNYSMAMQKYEEAILKQPSSALIPLVEQAMGMVSLDRGDPEDAVRHFRRSMEIAPFLAESYYWLGECYMRMKKNREAAESFRIVIEMVPKTELGLRAKNRLDALR